MDAEAEGHGELQRIAIDAAEQADQFRYDNGTITLTQLLQAEEAYAAERYALDRATLVDEAESNVDRVEAHAATLRKLAELDAKYQLKQDAIKEEQAQAAVARQKQVEGLLAGGIASGLQGLLSRTMGWKQAMLTAFTQVTNGLISMLSQWAAKKAAHYIMDQIMHKSSVAARLLAEKAAAASSIARASAIAGANGVASFALAPWPLDAYAPAFGASMASAAAGFGAVAIAEQGYDIPAGVNPLTQLHQKEMVLPAEQAEAVRQMTSTGGGDEIHLHVHALDRRDVENYLRRNSGAVAAAGRSAARDYRMGGKF